MTPGYLVAKIIELPIPGNGRARKKIVNREVRTRQKFAAPKTQRPEATVAAAETTAAITAAITASYAAA
jgi:hypothetical protein